MRLCRLTLLRPFIFIGLFALFLSGCASSSARFAIADIESQGLPRSMQLPVQFIPQRVNHCGPAVLSMAAGYATGLKPNVEAISRAVFTPGREGTLRFDMITGARRMGLLATNLNGFATVLAEVAAGNPVVLFENKGLSFAPVWHFSLLVGYDLDRGVALLHSDQQAFSTMSLDRLGHIWTRGGSWAFVITPPEKLPQVKDSEALLAAAHGLSRVGKGDLAHKAFGLIANAFPGDATAQFAHGNAAFALGSLSEAEGAYRRAITLGDEKGQAHNNLAYVLAKQGNGVEACATAKAAATLAPDDASVKDTVAELCRPGSQ